MKKFYQSSTGVSIFRTIVASLLVVSIQACATMDEPPVVSGPVKVELPEETFVVIAIGENGDIVDVQGNKANRGIPTERCRIGTTKGHNKGDKEDSLKPCSALQGRNVVSVENITAVVTRNSPPCLVVHRTGGDITYQYPNPCEE